MDDLKRALRAQVVIDKTVGKNIKITDGDVRTFFNRNHALFDQPEQVRVRAIFVADAPTAQRVEEQLDTGAPFDAVVQRFSAGASGIKRGGEVGWLRRGQTMPALEAAFGVPVGSASRPVRWAGGYYVVQVEERKPAVTVSLRGMYDRIVDQLRE